ncbi:NAD(P)-dependent dehydrogenase, short-chain alcohol dehydrogenase family [Marinobacter sp. LV10R510-11A]|uniref:SDR family NAD(P)-dependent oxidoreductase n=1 Tax=Marinobacter sp. LV10R510-11A TaxID=1415568 RepID=UPI000BB86FCE|nr:SDR family NAD(P)-dependent oxidoreductase [Marinobacter sp. LV10R510-11A]SOB76880.1 NAD(P)-dependent dehydrogenase, short-chain alcohol dehydrogenase family [Marinobacter sp. LV10R510-11A]
MKHILLAGVSGAIGGALAQALLARDEESIVVGLCRDAAKVPEPLRSHSRLTLLAWDAEDDQSPKTVARALEKTIPASKGIDTFIYAAGLLHDGPMFPEKRLEELEAKNMARAFAVNATGFPLLVQALLPWFRHRDLKRVVAISAKVGSIEDNRLGGWYAYRSSKAALNMLIRTLSVELPRRCKPIACVSLHPGTTDSALSDPFSQSLAQLQVHSPAETAENLMSVIEGLSAEDNGRFLSWDGSALPW